MKVDELTRDDWEDILETLNRIEDEMRRLTNRVRLRSTKSVTIVGSMEAFERTDCGKVGTDVHCCGRGTRVPIESALLPVLPTPLTGIYPGIGAASIREGRQMAEAGINTCREHRSFKFRGCVACEHLTDKTCPMRSYLAKHGCYNVWTVLA